MNDRRPEQTRSVAPGEIADKGGKVAPGLRWARNMMTPTQYRDALARLGLTQVAAGRLLGVGDRTSRRWARHGVHGAAVILLRLLLAGRITPSDINYVQRYRPICPSLPNSKAEA
jgi:hypothetical protein